MVRRPTQTSFTFLSVICFPMFPQKMMSWADSYVLLCECASYGSKRIPISPRIEQDRFMLFAADAFQETLPPNNLQQDPNVRKFSMRRRIWLSTQICTISARPHPP